MNNWAARSKLRGQAIRITEERIIELKLGSIYDEVDGVYKLYGKSKIGLMTQTMRLLNKLVAVDKRMDKLGR